jgi:uncharacterized protein
MPVIEREPAMTRQPVRLPVLAAARPSFTPPPSPGGAAHRFHAMIKPAGAACNLDCSYCFYLHKTELLGHERTSRMSDDVLEEHIRQYIEGQSAQEVVFSWQGGEPTLMGLAFFEKVVELQARYRKPFQRIENDLQTNGILLDDAWAAFLKKHGFIVGISVDGPRELHDLHRTNKGGKPTFDGVMRGIELLKKHGVPFNVLCVVNADNVRQPLQVYRFLRSLGTHRIQFTPCVEPRDFKAAAPARRDPAAMPAYDSPAARPGNPESIVTDWSVDPHAWGRFLCRVWDEWFRRDRGRVFVNFFENAVAQAMSMPAQMCTHAEFCGKALAVEHNGDVFSCDHFVYPEYRLGNIHQTHEGTMAYSAEQMRFGYAKRDTLPQHCRQCEHLNMCWGECPKNRLIKAPDGEAGLNYLCAGWKSFYAHVHRHMPEIARDMSSRTLR